MMLRSIMVQFLGFFVVVGVLASLAWLQHEYGHDFRQHPAVSVTATPTQPRPVSSAVGVNEVDQVIVRKLERGELSCVNGYVSALSVENGVARAYVIQTDRGPARCVTRNRRGVQTSL